MDLAYFLQEAAHAADKTKLAGKNPFRELGFDRGLPRLGWARPLDTAVAEEALRQAEKALEGKEQFIFVGMGGSANGPKALAGLSGKENVFVLDSLSSLAWEGLASKINSWQKTAVIAISKSGSTAETQRLAHTLKSIWGQEWPRHFLWLSDVSAFDKLRRLGWEEALMLPIQPDKKEDIGGRFSSPQTLVFLLPLYLLLGQRPAALHRFMQAYLSETEALRRAALAAAEKHKQDKPLFKVDLPFLLPDGFSVWITQLFNESFGSKKDGLPVKTLVGRKGLPADFSAISLQPAPGGRELYLACNMYFLQHFTAFYACFYEINFVSQPFVEKYKQAMKEAAEGNVLPPVLDIAGLKKAIAEKIKPQQRFIEIVLYFPFSHALRRRLEESLTEEFADREILIFEGSDWNHHSYQAAFGDKNTLYIFALCAKKADVPASLASAWQENDKLLQRIARATFNTLEDKSIYLQLEEC